MMGVHRGLEEAFLEEVVSELVWNEKQELGVVGGKEAGHRACRVTGPSPASPLSRSSGQQCS